jgi:O-antigen/teichoic acid export membrane protein
MSKITYIGKNTLALYFRQIIIMVVSLYTVRVVLNTLGTEDYGIYNVVGGLVTMFVMLTYLLSGASVKFFSLALGENDRIKLERLFNVFFTLAVLIAVAIFLLAETIGLWFINNVLAMPKLRMDEVRIVYHLSVVSFIITIVLNPFVGLVLSYEDMNIYAGVSVFGSFVKLGLMFLLGKIPGSKLCLYGLFICIAHMIDFVFYVVIVSGKYKINICILFDMVLLKKASGFSFLLSTGAAVSIIKFQVVNVLLNQFFNPSIIAARTLAQQIYSTVYSFAANFNQAMGPPIIKDYAVGRNIEFLLFFSSKLSFFLVYVIILPFFLEMPFVLYIWTKDIPQYAIAFSRLLLIEILIDVLVNQWGSAVNATGHIKLYQLLGKGLAVLNIPISYIALIMKYPPYSVMVVSIGVTFFMVVAQIIIVGRLMQFSLTKFLKTVVLPIVLIIMISSIVPLILYFNMNEGVARFFLVTGASVVVNLSLIFSIGLAKEERIMIAKIVAVFLHGLKTVK